MSDEDFLQYVARLYPEYWQSGAPGVCEAWDALEDPIVLLYCERNEELRRAVHEAAMLRCLCKPFWREPPRDVLEPLVFFETSEDARRGVPPHVAQPVAKKREPGCSQRGSNPRPAAHKTAALTPELRERGVWWVPKCTT